ncbi:hypothetical protein BKA69DRAFT_1070118 [Paraphysoderma sedebokerense]|nr:hypothetical protein BKA69DRAFT_1070118 [Paraphysoderma sedebokerense]
MVLSLSFVCFSPHRVSRVIFHNFIGWRVPCLICLLMEVVAFDPVLLAGATSQPHSQLHSVFLQFITQKAENNPSVFTRTH